MNGLKHQKEKRSMDHFAGLDVSVKETSICIVDDTGRIVREVKAASEPEALLQVLTTPPSCESCGHEIEMAVSLRFDNHVGTESAVVA